MRDANKTKRIFFELEEDSRIPIIKEVIDIYYNMFTFINKQHSAYNSKEITDDSSDEDDQ